MNFKIKKGYNIPVSGPADKDIADLGTDKVAYTLSDFPYLKANVLVKEGDRVAMGQPLFCDKKDPSVVFVSPAAGVVEEIRRGDRRKLLNVIVKVEGEEAVGFDTLDLGAVSGLDSQGAKKALADRGLWPALRRRPFHKVAETTDEPSALYVTCLDSNPLAADPNFYLDGREGDFQLGIALLSKICPNVHLCLEGNAEPASTFNAEGVQSHRFRGVHPRGNLSVHIDRIAPVLRQDKVVWSIRAQDVVSIGATLASGRFDNQRVFAWAGPAAAERRYYRTLLGASTASLPAAEGEIRRISGSILNGTEMGEEAFLGFYDHTVTALVEDRERLILGWLTPGPKSHSLTRAYIANALPRSSYDMTTTTNGEHRAIVDSEMYDKVQPIDIHTAFLYKTMLAGDIEESERLGLWSVAPEDFALASYMDPSKNDFGAPLKEMLDELYKEEA